MKFFNIKAIYALFLEQEKWLEFGATGKQNTSNHLDYSGRYAWLTPLFKPAMGGRSSTTDFRKIRVRKNS
jgi:hypothetical protein